MHFAIFQNWGLGDLVMTTPVVAEFRRLYPSSTLTLIVRGKAQAALMEDSPLVDAVLEMPPRSDIYALVRFFFDLRKRQIDVAFIGTRISPSLAWLVKGVTGVPVIIGDGDRYAFLYSYRNEVDPRIHRVDRMLRSFSMWSGQEPKVPRFPIRNDRLALQEADLILASLGLLSGRFVIVHPGSSVSGGTEKRIPASVAQRIVANILERCSGISVAYIFGPDEVDLIPSFTDLSDREFILSGHSLRATTGIISRAAGLIGTDSSLGHIAAALGIPTVTLCGPTIPSETAPYGGKATVIKRAERLECQPCWGTPLYGHCPYAVRCMNELPESEILEIVSSWDFHDQGY